MVQTDETDPRAGAAHDGGPGDGGQGDGGPGDGGQDDGRADAQDRGRGGAMSFSSVIGDLLGDVSELLRQELRLARAEAAEAVIRIQTGLVVLVTGLLLGVGALMLLLQALVAGLSEVWEPWLATTVVAVPTALVAFGLMWLAQRKLRLSAAYPRRTMRSVREDTQMVMRKFQ